MQLRRHQTFLAWTAIFIVFCLCIVLKLAVETQINYPATYHPSIRPIEARYRTNSLKKYSLGFDNLLASLMWVQLLQQSSHQPIQDEHVSWEFTYVDGVTDLDPDFEVAFNFGVTFLSVFKQDQLGAGLILEKWLKKRPYYWRANYLLGFFYFSEMHDLERGAKYILKAAEMEGAPSFVSSLGVRILSETGALAQALKMAVEIYPNVRDEEGRFRLRQRIRSLNYNLQKKGWETALDRYRKEKGAWPETLAELRPWLQTEMRTVAALFSERLTDELEAIIAEPFRFRLDTNRQQIVGADARIAAELNAVGAFRQKKR